MFSKHAFTARFGDPLAFIFKGQVWDTRLADGSPSDKRCGVCHHHIRYAFVLKKLQGGDFSASPEVSKIEIGKCCFHYFRKWNSTLHQGLFHAYQYESARTKAIEQDKKRFGDWADVRTQEKQWRQIKRRVLARIRELRDVPAPVGDVAALLKAATRSATPGKHAARWFGRQIEDMQSRLGKLSG